MSGGGGTNTVQQQSAPPPEFMNAYQNVLNQAYQTASRPYATPQAPVAGMNSYQTGGIADVNAAQGSYLPYMGMAQSAIQQSQNPLAPSYQPYANEAQSYYQAGGNANLMGTLSPYQSQAGSYYTAGGNADLMGTLSPYIGQAGQNFNAASNGINAQYVDPTQFSSGQLSQYMSPYTQNVVNATQAQFNNQNAQQQQGVVGNAIAEGAWGGDRSGVAQGITAGQQQLAQAPVIAGLYNQGYSQALNEFNTQQGVDLQAQEANQNQSLQSQMATAQQRLAAGQGWASLGNQAVGTAQQQSQNAFNAANGIAGLGGQAVSTAQQQSQNAFNAANGINQIGTGMLGAAQSQGYLNSQAGYAEANLGNQALSSALTEGNAMMGAGSALQQQQQAEMNSPYQQILAQQAYPFQTNQWLASIAEGTGGMSGGTSSTTSPGPSTLSQIGGAGLAGIGLLGGTGAFGASGWLAPAMTSLIGMLKDGGEVPHRAGGGMIPGAPPSVPGLGTGISGVVDIVPDASSLGSNHVHGMGAPRPPPAAHQQDPLGGIGGAMTALKSTDAFGKDGWMTKMRSGQQGSDQDMPVPPIPPPEGPPPPIPVEAASPSNQDGGGSGYATGGIISAPRAPRIRATRLAGIGGAHPFHPPGLNMAHGGGIDVSYPDDVAQEVAGQNAATDQSEAMALAMAASGGMSPAMMSGGMQRGGGIMRRADGGGIDGDDDSAPPVVISGSPDDSAPPPVVDQGIAGPPAPPQAAQVSTSPDSGGIAGDSSGSKPPSNSDIWTTLTAAGLGMMSGTSPFAGVNIGRGGLEGMQVGQQIKNRNEQIALRQSQQDANNLYRQGLLADKSQGRNIQQQRAETYNQLSQASAAQKMAMAALESARAASAGASHATEGDITNSAVKSLVGTPNPDNDNKPWSQADALRYVKGIDVRAMNAQTASRRADTTADLGQQRIDALKEYRSWQMDHGDATLEQTNQKIADAKAKGATDEDLRALGLLRNPLTGALPKGAGDTAHQMAGQLRGANAPEAPGGQPQATNLPPAQRDTAPGITPLPSHQNELVAGKVYGTARGAAKWTGTMFVPVTQ